MGQARGRKGEHLLVGEARRGIKPAKGDQGCGLISGFFNEFTGGTKFGGFTGAETLGLTVLVRKPRPLDGAGAAFEQRLGERDAEVADEDDGGSQWGMGSGQ